MEWMDSTSWPRLWPFLSKIFWTGIKVLIIGMIPWLLSREESGADVTKRPVIALASKFWTGVGWGPWNKVWSIELDLWPIAGSVATKRLIVITVFAVAARVPLMEQQPRLVTVPCDWMRLQLT